MPAPIVETDNRAIVLDLSTGAELRGKPIAAQNLHELSRSIEAEMEAAETAFAFGRWAEPRELYSTDLFDSESGESRSIHMGVDVFCRAGTPVQSPIAGVIEIVANNDRELDYGPVVIVRHDSDPAYTLYGHLSVETLGRVQPGQRVTAGDCIGFVGAPPTNGNWPPHLHFQLIEDLLGLGADFPGVAQKSEQHVWLQRSPSPAAFFPEVDPRLLEYSEG